MDLASQLVSGDTVALIAVLVSIEGVALWWLWRRHGHGLPPDEILWNLLSGAALMLAVAAALQQLPRPVIGGCLALSLIAHVIDLRVRWRRPPD